MVLTLIRGIYQEASFSGSEPIVSAALPGFSLSAAQILNPPE
jgi:hypothetical protein